MLDRWNETDSAVLFLLGISISRRRFVYFGRRLRTKWSEPGLRSRRFIRNPPAVRETTISRASVESIHSERAANKLANRMPRFITERRRGQRSRVLFAWGPEMNNFQSMLRTFVFAYAIGQREADTFFPEEYANVNELPPLKRFR